MADVLTYNAFLQGVSNDQTFSVPFYGGMSANGTAFCTGATGTFIGFHAQCPVMPALSNSITKYRLYNIQLQASVISSFGIYKCINLGSIDMNTGTFTDGSAFPTMTSLNTANYQTFGAIAAEATTALTGTSNTLTVTYNSNTGASHATAALALTNTSTIHQGAILNLNAPDSGASDITAVVRGGTTPSGTVKFWGLIPLAIVSNTAAAEVIGQNLVTDDFNWVSLGAGDTIKVVNLLAPATAYTVTGKLDFFAEK